MAFKFEKLEVWQLSLTYVDLAYQLSDLLPRSEEYNLKPQLIRAATSINLNIAEGSTGQTDTEQARFLGLALRSLLETVACQHLINRRGYLSDPSLLREMYRQSASPARKLQAMRKSLRTAERFIHEDSSDYTAIWTTDDGPWIEENEP